MPLLLVLAVTCAPEFIERVDPMIATDPPTASLLELLESVVPIPDSVTGPAEVTTSLPPLPAVAWLPDASTVIAEPPFAVSEAIGAADEPKPMAPPGAPPSVSALM